MEKFDYRHKDWNAAADKDVLHEEVMQCLKETKNSLEVNVKENVIYAEVEPEHLVEDLIVKFLAAQFEEHYVVIKSSRGTFVKGKDTAGVVRTRVQMDKMVKRLAVS